MRYLLDRYPRAIGTKLTYPKDSHPLDTPGDTWEYETTRAAGETGQYPRDKDLYAQAKEAAEKRTEAGHRKPEVFIPIYKNLYAAKYGASEPPFNDASAMVLPVKWTTGYSQDVQDALDDLTQLRAYATEIAESIGVINTTIQTLSGDVKVSKAAIKEVDKELGNAAWVKLQSEVNPGVVRTLRDRRQENVDLINSYNQGISRLRQDAGTLNQELYRVLNDYKKKAVVLGINDDFAQELKAATGSGRLQGTFLGGAGGMILAGLAVYALAQQRRLRPGARSGTGRGINNLFMRN